MKSTSTRGAASAAMLFLGALILMILAGGGCAVGRYNALASGQENVDAAFSEIDNQYKRRNDLIPQLVKTIKGATEYEASVLTEVTEARASVGRTQLPAGAAGDPEARAEYLKAQQNLGGAVGRLLVTMERYPELKATQGFLDMQTQIEGTENRITTARRDYIESVKTYNSNLRKFPGNIVGSAFGFERLPQLEAATAAEREVPDIEF